MAMSENVSAGKIIAIGLTGSLLVLVIGLGIESWFRSMEQREIASKSSGVPNLSLANLKAEQQARIQSYRWVNQSDQSAAIPIDQAMKLLIQNGGKLPTTQPVNTAGER